MGNGKDPLEVIGRARGYSKEEIIKNLPRHQSYSPSIIKQVRDIPEVVLRNSGSLMAKKIITMMREISKEAYRAKQFTRTELNNKGILYGVVSLKHKVMDIILRYFHGRWPNCITCLYNEYNGNTGIINEKGNIYEINLPLKQVVSRISEKRPIIPYFNDIQFSGEEIFETLYNSQSISERENRRYFKQMIPEHCFKLPGMKKGVEKRYTPNNKKLDDYF